MSNRSIDAYHGSLEWKARKIKQDGFFVSTKETEWLGDGIYFFDKKEHAIIWAQRESAKIKNIGLRPAIISATLHCDESEYMDLDTDSSMEMLLTCLEETFEDIEQGRPEFKNTHELRCFCCNLFKKMNPQYKIYSFTFSFFKDNPAGFRIVSQQKQYCVADNTYIQMGLVEVYDNAI